MILTTKFKTYDLRFTQVRTYLFISLFIIGNLILPQLCHFVPNGGKRLLPIFFFTLIGSYKYGLKVGLTTAILSPLINSMLFGMPAMAYLPIVMTKSVLLALFTALIAHRTNRLSLLTLFAVIAAYQLLGTVAAAIYLNSFALAYSDLLLACPGMLIQLFGGYLILNYLANK